MQDSNGAIFSSRVPYDEARLPTSIQPDECRSQDSCCDALLKTIRATT